jgi:hypothetical protein
MASLVHIVFVTAYLALSIAHGAEWYKEHYAKATKEAQEVTASHQCPKK